VDSEIARLRQQLDDLIASRKRWLAVTGGRSKMFNNGGGNGNGNGPRSNDRFLSGWRVRAEARGGSGPAPLLHLIP